MTAEVFFSVEFSESDGRPTATSVARSLPLPKNFILNESRRRKRADVEGEGVVWRREWWNTGGRGTFIYVDGWSMPLSATGLFPEHPLAYSHCTHRLQVGQPKARQVGVPHASGIAFASRSVHIFIWLDHIRFIRWNHEKWCWGGPYQARRREAGAQTNLLAYSRYPRPPDNPNPAWAASYMKYLFCKLEPPVGATFRFAAATAAAVLQYCFLDWDVAGRGTSNSLKFVLWRRGSRRSVSRPDPNHLRLMGSS